MYANNWLKENGYQTKCCWVTRAELEVGDEYVYDLDPGGMQFGRVVGIEGDEVLLAESFNPNEPPLRVPRQGTTWPLLLLRREVKLKVSDARIEELRKRHQRDGEEGIDAESEWDLAEELFVALDERRG